MVLPSLPDLIWQRMDFRVRVLFWGGSLEDDISRVLGSGAYPTLGR